MSDLVETPEGWFACNMAHMTSSSRISHTSKFGVPKTLIEIFDFLVTTKVTNCIIHVKDCICYLFLKKEWIDIWTILCKCSLTVSIYVFSELSIRRTEMANQSTTLVGNTWSS